MSQWKFFLGGRDLEMVEIARLLDGLEDVEVVDHGLAWGAKASAYLPELRASLGGDDRLVLVELKNDLPNDFPKDQITEIDHHGSAAGVDKPTSIEQVFQLLELPPEAWTRDLALVAANDRGGLDGLERAGATTEEMHEVRRRDRATQGITAEEEEEGRTAIQYRTTTCGGRLTFVDSPNDRGAAVCDALDSRLGGPGYQNLIILTPTSTQFYGPGHAISRLSNSFPGSWYGGELPRKGFWGLNERLELNRLMPLIEEYVVTCPSSEVDVRMFRHVVLWPVLMQGPAVQDKQEDPIKPWAQALARAGWTELSGESARVHPDYKYEEIVYFHPFVRDFLFGDGKDKPTDRTLRRFSRSDIKKVRVGIARGLRSKSEPWTEDLTVERVELYLIRPRVAVLLVEVSKPDDTKLSLEQVLHFQSQFRRLYPPYIIEKDGTHGDCLRSLEWLGEEGARALAPIGEHTLDAASAPFSEFAHKGSEPPLYAHWRALLGTEIHPFSCASDANAVPKPVADKRKLFVKQLLDDRMPALSFIAVEDPRRIQLDDLDRLPAFDPPGLDYDPDFRDGLRDSFRYTRFSHWGTTYYGNGTSMTMLAADSDFARNHLVRHFSQHYTRLALLAHYQHSALLSFEDELAESAKTLAGRAPDAEMKDWAANIREVQKRFLKFRTRSYFTEASNQIQGKELFQFWLNHLGTEKLFDQASSTIAEVHEVLENYEMKQLSEAQFELSRIAWWGLAISIVLSAFGAGVQIAGVNELNTSASLFGVLTAALSYVLFLGLQERQIPKVPFRDLFKKRTGRSKRST
jgi:hypothetical protein